MHITLRRLGAAVAGVFMVLSLAACDSGGLPDPSGAGSVVSSASERVQSGVSAAASAVDQAGRQLKVPQNALGPIPQEVLDAPPPAPDTSIGGMEPAGEAASKDGLTIQVFGTCGSNPEQKQALRLHASGFTPGGVYMTEAYFPNEAPLNGARYRFLKNFGYNKAANDGSTPAWTWDCWLAQGTPGDPPGTYKLTLHDLTTGKTVTTNFTVKY